MSTKLWPNKNKYTDEEPFLNVRKKKASHPRTHKSIAVYISYKVYLYIKDPTAKIDMKPDGH